MSNLTDLIAETRQKDAADLERQLKREEPSDLACHWCGMIFRSRGWDHWEKAHWIAEAGDIWHELCYQRAQEYAAQGTDPRR